MVRLVTVNCPYTWRDEVSQVIAGLSKRHLIYQNIRSTADENTIYTFKTKDKHLQNVLEEINSVGCGRDYGHIDVMQVLLSRPPISTLGEVSGKKKRAYRVSERMTVDEISCFIDDGNHLTFNYMILLFMASLIAGTGLLTDSSTTVIASMLVSPLMGPILSITFGCAVRDWETIRRGMRNELVGIMISLVTGLTMGFVASFLYPSDYRSSEIVGRGEAINLIGGFIVALASGIAVVVAVTMGGVNAIVGTAISASLLPPIVNCGICLAMSLKYHFDDDSGHDAYQYSLFGSISFCLFLVNFATIVAVGYLTFRFVKDVRPEHKRVYSMSMDSTCTTSSDSSSKKRTSKIQLNPLQDVTANTHSQSDDEVKNKQ